MRLARHAPSKDIDTATGSRSPASATPSRDYATVFAGVAGWAVFGTTLAVIFRSAPLALAVGFAGSGRAAADEGGRAPDAGKYR